MDVKTKLDCAFQVLGLQGGCCSTRDIEAIDVKLSRYATDHVDSPDVRMLKAARDYVLMTYDFMQNDSSSPIEPHSLIFDASGSVTKIGSLRPLSPTSPNSEFDYAYRENTPPEPDILNVFWKGWQFDEEDNIVYLEEYHWFEDEDDWEEYIIESNSDFFYHFRRLLSRSVNGWKTRRAKLISRGRMNEHSIAWEFCELYALGHMEIVDQLNQMTRGEDYTSPERFCEQFAELLVILTKLSVLGCRTPNEAVTYNFDLLYMLNEFRLFGEDYDRDYSWRVVAGTTLEVEPGVEDYMESWLRPWIGAIKWKWDVEAKKWSVAALWKEAEMELAYLHVDAGDYF